MHRKLIELSNRVVTKEDRYLLIDAAQKLRDQDEAVIILDNLCNGKRLTPSKWNRAFKFLKRISH